MPGDPRTSADPEVADLGDATPDLAWVTSVVWGASAETSLVGRASAGSSTAGTTFLALPNARHPHLLVPVDSPEVARRALQSYTDARRRIRAGSAILAAVIGARL